MQPHLLATIFVPKLVRFGQIWLDLGKIKILHPSKKFDLLRLCQSVFHSWWWWCYL